MSRGRLTALGTEANEHDFLLKVLLVGDSGVGKSCLINRYVDDLFSDQFVSTLGVDFKFKTVSVSGKKVKMQIWDTAGQERFRTITSGFYRGAHGIFIVYDCTNRDSYDHVPRWMDDIQKNVVNSTTDITYMLIGNKSDMRDSRVISTSEGEEMAHKLGMRFMETSAKTSDNVDHAFTELAQRIVESLVMMKKSESGVGDGDGERDDLTSSVQISMPNSKSKQRQCSC